MQRRRAVGSADAAISVVDAVGAVARLAVTIGKPALPIAQFVAGFIPGAAPIVQIIAAAEPYIETVANAAPKVDAAINAGRPIFDAFDQSAPKLLPALKSLLALATSTSEDKIKTEDAFNFAGPIVMGREWTDAEYQAWWDRASGLNIPG